jgi:hypothetical protein
MTHTTGRRVPLSLPQRYLADLIQLAQTTPALTVQRRMRLWPTVAARAVASPRPSWHALFTKAFALTARNCPPLRRAYLPFPWPHLYEHPVSVASVALERRCLDEETILFAPIVDPESLSLPDLDGHLRRCKDGPLEAVAAFRRCLRLARWPGAIRRLLLRLAWNCSGPNRARVFGTFGVSAYSSLGAEALRPLALVTTTLTHGVIALDGTVDVRISYDPRVLTGPTVARVLADLEGVLTHEILAELRYLEALEEAA